MYKKLAAIILVICPYCTFTKQLGLMMKLNCNLKKQRTCIKNYSITQHNIVTSIHALFLVSCRTTVCCTRRRGTSSCSPCLLSWSAGARTRSWAGCHAPASVWWCASRPTWARGSRSAVTRPWLRTCFPRSVTSCATLSMPAGTMTPRTSSASRSMVTATSTLSR